MGEIHYHSHYLDKRTGEVGCFGDTTELEHAQKFYLKEESFDWTEKMVHITRWIEPLSYCLYGPEEIAFEAPIEDMADEAGSYCRLMFNMGFPPPR